MKSLMSLWSIAANELAARCCTSATHDITTVLGRTEHEGLSFLAITLADLGKATQKWLDLGLVVSSDCPAFKTAGPRSKLPAFLQGFYRRVFDPCSGVLLENPDIEAIYALRQLTLMFSKIAPPEDPSNQGGPRQVVTPGRGRRAMLDYVQCEQDVKFSDSILDQDFKSDFERMSEVLFGDFFDWCEFQLVLSKPVPKHGPGAVAERISSNSKYSSRTWTTRLQSVFRAEDYLVPNGHFNGSSGTVAHFGESATAHCYSMRTTGFNILEPGSETPVRVVSVPKTLSSPRIIAIEPTCMQYVQQAMFRLFREGISRNYPLSTLIGIDDQNPNRVLAREGSFSGNLATLDLSEASDRVSNQHVLSLFADRPVLLGMIDACRSRKADVPGHGVLRLAKFASMGSALCFPIEAMVFLTVIFLGIERELSAPLSDRSDILPFCQQVRVFGDDIIIPKEYVLSVVNELGVFGHKVNVDKSFWTGRFRESCGREYFDGQDVSIVKVRQDLPTRRQDGTGVIAAVSLRNQAYWSGLWKTASWLDAYLGKLLKHFPNVAPSSPVLGRESALGYQFQRLDPFLHSPLVKGFYVKAEPPPDLLEGDGALLKCLLRSMDPTGDIFAFVRTGPRLDAASVDDEHLERSGRPERVNIRLGWRSPF